MSVRQSATEWVANVNEMKERRCYLSILTVYCLAKVRREKAQLSDNLDTQVRRESQVLQRDAVECYTQEACD